MINISNNKHSFVYKLFYSSNTEPFSRKKNLLLVLFAIIIFFFLHYNYPIYNHWEDIYRPAALRFIQGQNPYEGLNYFNPPWTLIPLIPFALLPIKIGNSLLGVVTIISFVYVLMRKGASLSTVLLFITLPVAFYNVIQINIDWLLAIGLLLPPQFGLFLVLTKPQIGIFLTIFWLYNEWKSNGLLSAIRMVAPVTIAFFVSLLIYGNFVSKGTLVFHDSQYSFWPFSIAFGLAIFNISFRLNNPGLTYTAAILLSPYVQPYSIPLAVFGLIPDKKLANIFLSGLWLIMLDPARIYIFTRIFEPLFTWLPKIFR